MTAVEIAKASIGDYSLGAREGYPNKALNLENRGGVNRGLKSSHVTAALLPLAGPKWDLRQRTLMAPT